jgi:hypothetical protein
MGNAEEVADDVVDEDKFSTNIDEIIAGLDGGDDSEPQEFAEGGVVKADPSYKDAPIKGFRMVQYEDPETKAVKYIPFVNGKPLLPIPKGYVEKKAVVPTTPPTTPPVEEQPVSPVGGGNGGGGRGGRPETDGEGGGVSVQAGDTGIEGFGDIQSGTSPNIARALGLGLGFVNPAFGALVSLGGQYATKKNNEVMAKANAQAISFSALEAAGFEAKDITAAQEAAAKATMEGKSAKEVAVAAANAASLSAGTALGKSVDGNYGAKTSLDALIGITNGWNTANKDVMSMPKELADKVEPRAWSNVVKAIDEGLTPEQAATLSMTKIEGSIPAGEYDNVISMVKEGYSVREAIDTVTMRQDAIVNAEKVQEERNAEVVRQEAERADEQTRQEAADRAERTQAERNAEVSRQESERADAQTRQEAADRAERTQAERNAEVSRQERDRAEADRAERDAQAAQEARADRESKNSGGDYGGESGGLGEGSGGGRYA